MRFLLFLFTLALATNQMKIAREALTWVGCEQSIKKPRRKGRAGCGSSVLCMEGWDFWAAVLDVPLPVNVFGKDGATAKVIWGEGGASHNVPLPGEPLFWRQLYMLELVKCFRAAAYFAFWRASGCRWFPKRFVGGWCPSSCFVGSSPAPQPCSTRGETKSAGRSEVCH